MQKQTIPRATKQGPRSYTQTFNDRHLMALAAYTVGKSRRYNRELRPMKVNR